MRLRIPLLVLVAALLIPAAALAHSTRVVPFKTVAGVPLKLTPSQVIHRLGHPSHTVRVAGEVAEYDYNRIDLTVAFDTNHHPDRANFVGVTVGAFSRHIAFRTVHGIHIGSPAAAVRKAFGKPLKCGDGTCVMWKGAPGADGSTSFNITFTNGKVAEFDNQFVFKDF